MYSREEYGGLDHLPRQGENLNLLTPISKGRILFTVRMNDKTTSIFSPSKDKMGPGFQASYLDPPFGLNR